VARRSCDDDGRGNLRSNGRDLPHATEPGRATGPTRRDGSTVREARGTEGIRAVN
jgi:hypothetical protein